MSVMALECSVEILNKGNSESKCHLFGQNAILLAHNKLVRWLLINTSLPMRLPDYLI